MKTTGIARLERFREILQSRLAALRGEIAGFLARSQREDYVALAGQVRDRGDESLADLLVDLNYSGVEHDVEEVQDVEAALRRLDQGSFGACIDCGTGIPIERLLVYPTAKRCSSCQRRHEAALPKPPSL